jgi:D-alanyl-lipoteichoic acid acyltransferase DltB (MBOAT superfamily)
MLFNSYAFIFVFLPAVLLGFFQLGRIHPRYAAAWLALASLAFYGYWNPAYIGLLLGSIVCNYAFGTWIAKSALHGKGSTPLLAAAIVANLALLGYYKYANFFLSSVNALSGSSWSLGEIMLPLGISFFTFTQIAFLVDTWQGKVKEYNFVHYVLFVTYFPHLIAGPVLHHKEMMPQFAHTATYRLDWDNIANGLMLFTLGLCKKTLVADALAPYATAIFTGAQHGVETGILPTAYEAWAGALAYTLQIYFDFSGYTDMALGIALMFGIRLPINFDSPYKAASIIEFWRRWHMTLSRFLRDYLYIPLGGNRQGKLRRYINLFITMLLGGLWHGAGWTFVLWGALHGAYLTINHLWRDYVVARLPFRAPAWLAAFIGATLTFIAVVTAWVLFRASDMSQASTLLQAMYGIAARPISLDAVLHGQLLLVTEMSGRDLVKLLAFCLAWVWLFPNSTRLRFLSGGNGLKRGYGLAIAQAAAVIILLYMAMDQFGSYSPFLYFQF